MIPRSAQSSLSHWTTTRPGIVAGSSGTTSSSRPAAEHHAARVLAEVAREPDDGVPERGEAPDPRVREVGAGAPEVAGRRLLVRILVAPAGDVLGEPVEEVRREAERLARPRGPRAAAGR